MCESSTYGHLHFHTIYSLLDGLNKPEEAIRTIRELGQDFVAITDHGSTSGLYEMQRYGDKHGVKVIHGEEFYYERENDGRNGHFIVVPGNKTVEKGPVKLQYGYEKTLSGIVQS